VAVAGFPLWFEAGGQGMLVVETIARIRREHFVKGKTIKEIARDLGVSRNTVRRVLRSGETSFEYERTIQPRPKLGRWTAELEELLEANAAKPAREQLTLIRIHEELRGRGYDGSYDAVRLERRPDTKNSKPERAGSKSYRVFSRLASVPFLDVQNAPRSQ
jgi:transposase-like protein